MEKAYEDLFRVRLGQVDVGWGGEFDLLLREKRSEGRFVDLPYLTMKSFVVVVVKLLVLHHPIPELIELKISSMNVDIVGLEDAHRKLLNHVMDIRSRNLDLCLANLDFECRTLSIAFLIHVFQYFRLHFTFKSITDPFTLNFINPKSSPVVTIIRELTDA